MKAVVCLSQEARVLLTEAMMARGESPALLQEVKECAGGEVVGFGNAGKAGKAKRAGPPSKYNLFVSACMKSKNIKGTGRAPAAMKECAAEWQRQKRQQ